MKYETWHMFIQACYGSILFPLYIFVLINFLVPTLNRPFQSYFFKIATILGFVDITSYITVWIFVKLPDCPLTHNWFINAGDCYLFNILAFLRYYTTLVRCYLLVLTSINRFTSIYFAIKNAFWWNKYGRYLILFSLILPLIFTFERLFRKLRVWLIREGIVVDTEYNWILSDQSLILGTHTLVTGCATFILNMLCLKALRRRDHGLNIETHKFEKALLIISFWDFFVDSFYIALSAWQVYRNLFGRTSTDGTPYVLVIWVLDLNNLFRPIILILMCKSLKKAFLKYLLGLKIVNKIENMHFSLNVYLSNGVNAQS